QAVEGVVAVGLRLGAVGGGQAVARDLFVGVALIGQVEDRAGRAGDGQFGWLVVGVVGGLLGGGGGVLLACEVAVGVIGEGEWLAGGIGECLEASGGVGGSRPGRW